MQQFLPDGAIVRGAVARRASVRRLIACVAVALCVACGALTDSASAEKGKPDAVDDRLTARPDRWWLQIYAHTMQEEAFLQWMDHLHHGPAWRLTMPAFHVNAMFAWWLRNVWNPAHGFDSQH